MNLTIDIGNTRSKWALFEGDQLVRCGYMDEGLPCEGVKSTMVCASGDADLHALGLDGDRVQRLTAGMPLPIALDYATPETLGPDRIAAACGAQKVGNKGCPKLIIDAGTCITIDYLDAEGVYHGGAILPGIEMKFRALHTFTAKLPLVSLDTVEHTPVMGRSTEESIVAGTLGATLLALAGYVALYKEKAAGLHVLLTGGDAARLSAGGTKGWEHVPLLTLQGMNEIMRMQEAGCVN